MSARPEPRARFSLAEVIRLRDVLPFRQHVSFKECGLTDFREKVLYHQIHPLKLAMDWGMTVPGLWLVWGHRLLWGLVVSFIPSAIASFLLIRFTDLDKLKQSPFGKYIDRYMTGLAQFWRLAGFGIMVIGAWYHLAWLITLGLAVILLAWGVITERIKGQE